MKSILLSIRPNWTAKILNGEKTIEIRKQFPKDYVGWVYIYCTKGKERLVDLRDDNFYFGGSERLNGKVVARFWCDKVGRIFPGFDRVADVEHYEIYYKDTGELVYGFNVEKRTCLYEDQLDDYLGECCNGYAIHISKLEVFEKPRELSGFKLCCKKFEKNPTSYSCVGCKYCCYDLPFPATRSSCLKKLIKAPQNYCYVEGEEK